MKKNFYWSTSVLLSSEASQWWSVVEDGAEYWSFSSQADEGD